MGKHVKGHWKPVWLVGVLQPQWSEVECGKGHGAEPDPSLLFRGRALSGVQRKPAMFSPSPRPSRLPLPAPGCHLSSSSWQSRSAAARQTAQPSPYH